MEESPSRIHTAPSSEQGTPADKGYRHVVDALALSSQTSNQQQLTPSRTVGQQHHTPSNIDLTPSSAKRILKQMMFGLDTSKDADYDDGAVGSSDHPYDDEDSSSCDSSVASPVGVIPPSTTTQIAGPIHLAVKSNGVVSTQRCAVERPLYGCSDVHASHHAKLPSDAQFNYNFEGELTSPFKRPYSCSRSRTGDSFSHASDVTTAKITKSILKDADDDVIAHDDYTTKKMQNTLGQAAHEGGMNIASKLSRRIAGPGEPPYQPAMNYGAGYGSIEFNTSRGGGGGGAVPTTAALLSSPQLTRRNNHRGGVVPRSDDVATSRTTAAAVTASVGRSYSPPGASPLKKAGSRLDEINSSTASERELRKMLREEKRAQRLSKRDQQGSIISTVTNSTPPPLRRGTRGPFIQSDPEQSPPNGSRHLPSQQPPVGVSRPAAMRNDAPTSSPSTVHQSDATSTAKAKKRAPSSGDNSSPYRLSNDDRVIALNGTSQYRYVAAAVAPESIVHSSPPSNNFHPHHYYQSSSSSSAHNTNNYGSEYHYTAATGRGGSGAVYNSSRGNSPNGLRVMAASSPERIQTSRSNSASPNRYRYLSGAPPPPRRQFHGGDENAATGVSTSHHHHHAFSNYISHSPKRGSYTNSTVAADYYNSAAAAAGYLVPADGEDYYTTSQQLAEKIKGTTTATRPSMYKGTNTTRTDNAHILESLFYRSIQRRCKQHKQLVHPFQEKTPKKGGAYTDPQLEKVPAVGLNGGSQRADGLNSLGVDRTYHPTFASAIHRENARVGLGSEKRSMATVSRLENAYYAPSRLEVGRLRSTSTMSSDNDFGSVSANSSLSALASTLGARESASRQRRLKLLRENSTLLATCARDKPHEDAVRVARKSNAAEVTQDDIDRAKRSAPTMRLASRASPSPLSEFISTNLQSPPSLKRDIVAEPSNKSAAPTRSPSVQSPSARSPSTATTAKSPSARPPSKKGVSL